MHPQKTGHAGKRKILAFLLKVCTIEAIPGRKAETRMFEWEKIARQELQDGIALREQAARELAAPLAAAAQTIAQAIRQGGKLLICGNGGSAADA
ncbi:SIS domain-containing protein, partial [candidate division FCPU426 bacterium]|nr:SIS domain-containing protein [candidate division FCPU426 bacterium]